MSVLFDSAGMEAEKLAAIQFKGVLTSKLDDQYKDIDLLVQCKQGSWKTVSVKDQRWSSSVYGSIQVETLLTNTETGQTMPGCFVTNDCDYYFWRVTVKDTDTWFIIECSKLRDWVDANTTLTEWQTKGTTEQKNKLYGRKFNRANGKRIMLTDIISMGKLIRVRG